MPKQRQKLNISSLQDFVLDERNIEKMLNFTSNKPKIVKKKSKQPVIKKQIHTDFLLPRFSDTLFWCYYIMKNGLLIGCHQGLKNKDIDYIHTKVLNFLKSKSAQR